jgi:uncharacterized membrane protein
MIWAVKSIHVLSTIVWLGGMMYQTAVKFPISRAGNMRAESAMVNEVQRFLPIVWMCVWSVLVTGVALMLFNPKFIFLQYGDRWSVIVGLKQLTFVVMMVFSFGYARMFARMKEALDAKPEDIQSEQVALYGLRLSQFARLVVALGILGVFLTMSL